MTSFLYTYTPTHLKTHRILPGHGHGARGYQGSIPGIDRTERESRRRGWTDRQAGRRRTYGIGGSLSLAGAVLALLIALLAALGPQANVLDRLAPEPAVTLVDATTLTTPARPAQS